MIETLRYKAENIKAKIEPEFFNEVADKLEKQAEGWISVKDRLPEKNKVVLCWAENITIQGGGNRIIGLCSNGFWFLQSHGEIGMCSGPVTDYKVLAWMELPEPYREDGGLGE